MRTLFLSFSIPILGLLMSLPCLATVREYSFQQEGKKRSYLLYRPKDEKRFSGQRPVMLVLHGGGSTHRGMHKLTGAKWNALADQHGFFVAYPNAYKRHWNFGEGKTSLALKEKVDDRLYFENVLNLLATQCPIDQKRVFATGISRGGQACFFLVGKLPGRVRGIAPVAMSLPDHFVDDVRRGPPCALILFNGTGDPQVPYGGGEITVFRKKRGQVLSTDDTIALWRKRNGCRKAPVATNRNHALDKTSVMQFSSVDGRAPVILYQITNGGHTWPRGSQYLPVRTVGEVSQDVEPATEIWEVFRKLK